MKRSVQCLLIVVGVCFSLTLFTANAQAMLWASDWGGNIYTVNATDASLNLVGSTGLRNLGGLEFAPDGTLYGIGAGNDAALYTIDRNTAAATYIGNVSTDPFDLFLEGALAFSPSGVAYAAHMYDPLALPSELMTIDLSTGLGTAVAGIGTTYHDINGLMWRGDGMLVGLDDNPSALVTIDPTTGAFSTLNTLGFGAGGVSGMTADQSTGISYFATGIINGNDNVAGSNSLYSFDPYTGAYTEIGGFGPLDNAGISGLAGTPIPEPGTLGLLTLGLAGAAALRRKRK